MMMNDHPSACCHESSWLSKFWLPRAPHSDEVVFLFSVLIFHSTQGKTVFTIYSLIYCLQACFRNISIKQGTLHLYYPGLMRGTWPSLWNPLWVLLVASCCKELQVGFAVRPFSFRTLVKYFSSTSACVMWFIISRARERKIVKVWYHLYLWQHIMQAKALWIWWRQRSLAEQL